MEGRGKGIEGRDEGKVRGDWRGSGDGGEGEGDNGEENNRDGQIRREGETKQREKMTKVWGVVMMELD